MIPLVNAFATAFLYRIKSCQTVSDGRCRLCCKTLSIDLNRLDRLRGLRNIAIIVAAAVGVAVAVATAKVGRLLIVIIQAVMLIMRIFGMFSLHQRVSHMIFMVITLKFLIIFGRLIMIHPLRVIAINHNAFKQTLALIFGKLTQNSHRIFTLDFITRMHKTIGQFATGGKN